VCQFSTQVFRHALHQADGRRVDHGPCFGRLNADPLAEQVGRELLLTVGGEITSRHDACLLG
jgi:hypothetical protein